VARHWNFPERLLEGMQTLKARDITPPQTDVQRLKVAANLANDLYVVALRGSQVDKSAALDVLSKRYSAAIKLDVKDLIQALEQGLKEVAERAAAASLPTAQSPALKAVRKWVDPASVSGVYATPVAERAADNPMQDVTALSAPEGGNGTAPSALLSAGIRDITETLTSDFELNDVLQMALETMYRGIGFSRTMMFIRDPRAGAMRARFGFGAGIEAIIPQSTFPLAFAPDVFHVALEKGLDIVIENTEAENVVQRIPPWHRQVLKAKSFLLLPVMLKGQAVGLLYADSERAEGIKVNPEQLDLLRTLRTQVVLAFKHCGAPGR
jgi:hypothetical protein